MWCQIEYWENKEINSVNYEAPKQYLAKGLVGI